MSKRVSKIWRNQQWGKEIHIFSRHKLLQSICQILSETKRKVMQPNQKLTRLVSCYALHEFTSEHSTAKICNAFMNSQCMFLHDSLNTATHYLSEHMHRWRHSMHHEVTRRRWRHTHVTYKPSISAYRSSCLRGELVAVWTEAALAGAGNLKIKHSRSVSAGACVFPIRNFSPSNSYPGTDGDKHRDVHIFVQPCNQHTRTSFRSALHNKSIIFGRRNELDTQLRSRLPNNLHPFVRSFGHSFVTTSTRLSRELTRMFDSGSTHKAEAPKFRTVAVVAPRDWRHQHGQFQAKPLLTSNCACTQHTRHSLQSIRVLTLEGREQAKKQDSLWLPKSFSSQASPSQNAWKETGVLCIFQISHGSGWSRWDVLQQEKQIMPTACAKVKVWNTPSTSSGASASIWDQHKQKRLYVAGHQGDAAVQHESLRAWQKLSKIAFQKFNSWNI